MEFDFDVFLSHSAKDKEIVRPIADRLKVDGLRVWFDDWEVKPGDSIPAKIEDGLECSRVLVLCMSANAFGSDWAQLESQTFQFRDPLNKERRFIPLRLDDAPVKGTLAQFSYINWQSMERQQEYAKLYEACGGAAPAAIRKTTKTMSQENDNFEFFIELPPGTKKIPIGDVPRLMTDADFPAIASKEYCLGGPSREDWIKAVYDMPRDYVDREHKRRFYQQELAKVIHVGEINRRCPVLRLELPPDRGFEDSQTISVEELSRFARKYEIGVIL